MWNSNNWYQDRHRWYWFETDTPPLLVRNASVRTVLRQILTSYTNIKKDFGALGWSTALTDIAAPPSSWNFQPYAYENLGDARRIETQEYWAYTQNPDFPYPNAKRQATGAYMDLARERLQGMLIAQSYASPADAAKTHWTSRAPEAVLTLN